MVFQTEENPGSNKMVGGLGTTRTVCLPVIQVRTASHQVDLAGLEPVSPRVQTSLCKTDSNIPGNDSAIAETNAI